MTSEVLKWIASALIGIVFVCTVWMAHAVHPDGPQRASLIAEIASAAGGAASAPLAGRH
jgi:hypothetical protein